MAAKLSNVIYGILVIIICAVVLYIFFPGSSVKELTIIYPYNGALFHPEIAPLTVRWEDDLSRADLWEVRIEFEDKEEPMVFGSETAERTPKREIWETIKKRSLEKKATITIQGEKKSLIGKLLSRNKPLSRNSVTISV